MSPKPLPRKERVENRGYHYKSKKREVDEAYITTSGIQKPPRHPLSFSEKVKHMSKMGVPKNRIIQEKFII